MYHLSYKRIPVGTVLNWRPECLTEESCHDWIRDNESVAGIFATDHQHIGGWRTWMNYRGITCYVYKIEPLGEVVKMQLGPCEHGECGIVETPPPEWFIVGGAVVKELYKTFKPEQYLDPIEKDYRYDSAIALPWW
jgi:hypothetical protein